MNKGETYINYRKSQLLLLIIHDAPCKAKSRKTEHDKTTVSAIGIQFTIQAGPEDVSVHQTFEACRITRVK